MPSARSGTAPAVAVVAEAGAAVAACPVGAACGRGALGLENVRSEYPRTVRISERTMQGQPAACALR